MTPTPTNREDGLAEAVRSHNVRRTQRPRKQRRAPTTQVLNRFVLHRGHDLVSTTPLKATWENLMLHTAPHLGHASPTEGPLSSSNGAPVNPPASPVSDAAAVPEDSGSVDGVARR